jgi:hypothetical protein
MSTGSRSASWDGRDRNGHRVSSGVYFYRLDAGARHANGKMLVLR